MRVGIITLFPDMFNALQFGMTRIGQEKQKISFSFWNPRDYATDKHSTVDDSPYGGGPGMVMKVEPLRAAIADARRALPTAKIVYLSPQGRLFSHEKAIEAATQEELILLCGRYEGIDERLIKAEVDEEWSIGDYVLSGGELPAMVIIDAICRLLPDVLGDENSALEDSFAHGLLDYPHYTRPAIIDELAVPPVLLSGDHAAIKRWRLKQALGRTWERRPDLLTKRSLNSVEQTLLVEYQQETECTKSDKRLCSDSNNNGETDE